MARVIVQRAAHRALTILAIAAAIRIAGHARMTFAAVSSIATDAANDAESGVAHLRLANHDAKRSAAWRPALAGSASTASGPTIASAATEERAATEASCDALCTASATSATAGAVFSSRGRRALCGNPGRPAKRTRALSRSGRRGTRSAIASRRPRTPITDPIASDRWAGRIAAVLALAVCAGCSALDWIAAGSSGIWSAKVAAPTRRDAAAAALRFASHGAPVSAIRTRGRATAFDDDVDEREVSIGTRHEERDGRSPITFRALIRAAEGEILDLGERLKPLGANRSLVMRVVW